MDKKLEKKLIDEFPSFFKDIYGDPKKTCMSWGCDVSDGWFDLIYETCKKVAALDDGKFYFTQVKEKFGGLCLYCTRGSQAIYDIIHEAEKESYTICEKCGVKEDVTSEGSWIVTLCKKCRVAAERPPLHGYDTILDVMSKLEYPSHRY